MYVEARNIDKHFGSYHALDQVSFGIEKGELVALLGPSGSGKTTVLRTIAGLESADSGEIVIDGRCVNKVPGSERGIGFVFQNYALFRAMTVKQNIAFGLDVAKVPRAESDKRVAELIDLIGLSGLEQRYPNQLSGGQRQRVAFARALAPNPHVLLLDEPFAAIDAKVRRELRQWLRETIRQLGITSIFVTHDQDEALEVADRIIVMNEGRIEQIGFPAQIYETPESAFVAQFAGNAPIISDYGRFNGFEKNDDESMAIVRPEYVEAFRADNPAFADVLDVAQEARVLDISFRGFYFEVKLDIDGMVVYAHRGLSRRRTLEIGSKVLMYVERLYVIHADNRVEVRDNAALK